jgi:clan AA aspartic protease (TIGR02281 family)
MHRLLAIAVTAILGFSALAMLATGMHGASSDEPLVVASADAGTTSAVSGEGGLFRIERDGSGQFRVDAFANGEDARFLVDTGADIVAFGPDEAERLGIEFDPASFAPIGRSASGTARGVMARLDRLELGGREFRDIDVAVIDGLHTNLLGQNLLRQMGRVSISGDRMTIGG